MKKIIAASALALILFAPGCAQVGKLMKDTSVKQISSIVLNGPILIHDIERVYDDLAKLQKEKKIFTEEELEVFAEAMSTFEIVKTEYETLIALEMIPSTEDAMVMWKQARTGFTDSMNIIQSKRDQYSSRTLINIDIMDAHAKRADIDVMALLSNPTAGNLSEVLKVIGGLVKIGTKVAVLL